jgi:hypothetical protein
MTSFQPYRNGYHSRKRKTLILIAVLSFTILVFLIFFLSDSRKDSEQANNPNPPLDNPVEPAAREDTSPDRAYIENRTQPDELPAETGILPEENANDPPPPDRKIIEPEDSSEDWVSDVDRKREQGLLDFDDAIQKCRDKRNQIAELQAEYDTDCTGTSFDAYGNPVVNAQTLKCRTLQSRIIRLRSQLNGELDQAKYRARKAGVYPGQIRDVLGRYNFPE